MKTPFELAAYARKAPPGAGVVLSHSKSFRISCTWDVLIILLFFCSIFAFPLHAQDTPSPGSTDDLNSKPAPILSAGMGFLSYFQGGQPHLHPLVSPVILVPLGERWLVESRGTFEADFAQNPGSSAFHGSVDKEVDYVQLDYIANPYLTVTVGRFLTPFGVFNERLYPIWIRDLQSDPLILPLATGPSGAGTGAMVRGGISTNKRVTLNYAGYYSTLITTSTVDSARFAGGRAGIFLPGPRLEVGGSFQHLLQDDDSNSFGFHFAWQPPQAPVDIRAEYARTSQGSGYWVESAYRFAQPPFWQDFLSHVQVVGRMQEYFASAQPDRTLMPVNTKMFEFGLNYYFRDDLRFVSSFGRQFASRANVNVWTLAMTYRFVLPLVGGVFH